VTDKNDPQLRTALHKARKLKCPIVVAKLDRLSRDVAFVAGLMAQRVPFAVAELGPASTRSSCTYVPRSLRRNGR